MNTRLATKINKQLGGSVLNKSSLGFAESIEQDTRGKYRKASIWIRAIIIDHPFTDANKRTAYLILSKFTEIHDEIRVADALINIAKKNITNVDKIVEMIKNANRPSD